MSIWTDWLSQDPSAQFHTSLGQQGGKQGMSPFMRRYFQNQYNPIYNQFLGALGGQVQGGQKPDQTFGGFLNQFPWQQEFQSLPAWQRGFNPASAPRSKWLVY